MLPFLQEVLLGLNQRCRWVSEEVLSTLNKKCHWLWIRSTELPSLNQKYHLVWQTSIAESHLQVCVRSVAEYRPEMLLSRGKKCSESRKEMYLTHPEAPLWMTRKLGWKPPSPAENLNTRLMFYTFWQQQCQIWLKRVENVENTALLDVWIGGLPLHLCWLCLKSPGSTAESDWSVGSTSDSDTEMLLNCRI